MSAITVTDEERRGLELVVGPSWEEWEIERQEVALVIVRNMILNESGLFDVGEGPPSLSVVPDGVPTVIEALAQVKRVVSHVSKDRTTTGVGDNYRFRGIEAILGAIHGPMGDAGVVTVPKDLEVQRGRWDGKGFADWILTRVHVEWTIYGPAGDTIVTDNWGEALDNADKGLGKARSYAQKDLWIRLLEIPTDDPDVGDTEDNRDDAGPVDPPMRPENLLLVLEQLRTILDRTDGRYPREWVEARYPKVETLDLMLAGETVAIVQSALPGILETLDAVDRRLGKEDQILTAAAGAARTETAPCEICGSTRSKRVTHEDRWICADPKGCAERAKDREVEEATDGSIDCAGCGKPIGPDDALTWGLDAAGSELPYHPEHNPTPGGQP